MHPINEAVAIAGCLHNVVWRNKRMRSESKTKQTTTTPVMTYDNKAATDTNRTKSKMRESEMKTLMAIAF